MQRETLARILVYDVQVRVFGGVLKSVAKTLDQVVAEEFGELEGAMERYGKAEKRGRD